jgi:hypothetical protein
MVWVALIVVHDCNKLASGPSKKNLTLFRVSIVPAAAAGLVTTNVIGPEVLCGNDTLRY